MVAVALLGGYAVAVAALAWQSRGWPLVHDAPLMHYIAWRISEGAAPYRDLFDMNFPGVYLLHLGVLGLLGPGDAAWRAVDLSWLALGAGAVAAFAAAWGWEAATGGGLLFAFHHLAAGPWQAGQRDFLMCPFLLLGALGVARWVEGSAGPRGLAGAGLAFGVAATIKPHAALLAAGLGLIVLAAAPSGARWRAGAAYAGAAALPLLAAGLWVAALGAWPAWRALVVDFLVPVYARLARPATWGFYRWEVWVPLGAAVLIGLGHALARGAFGARRLVALVGVGYGLAHYVVQGKGWEYHVYPLAAFAATLGFAELAPAWRSRRWPAALSIVAALGVAAVMLQAKGADAVASAEHGWIAEKIRRVAALSRDLRSRLEVGDQVQVLDTTEGGIHALLQLGVVQPSRFLYDFPFFHDLDSPTRDAFRAELMQALSARPPRMVVVLERGWPSGGYERVQRFPELARLLAGSYRPVAHGDGYVIYARHAILDAGEVRP